MDGLQVLTELKKSRKTKKIPVIMLTAKSAMSDLDFAFEIGADDYITKPVAVRDLALKIEAKLSKINSK
jgi:DNA-binding response OmpR family regulator